MAIELVRDYFRSFNIEDRILEFDVSSATVDLAAQALNCEPKRIAKTMGFMTKEPILVVTAGDARVDNRKFKDQFVMKAKMLNPDELIQYIGHEVGGVCPFGISKDIAVYLDLSLKRFETVYPACGSVNSAIELRLDELEKYSNYLTWIDVCKNWE